MWFNTRTLTLVIVSLSHITSISGLINPVYYDRWISFLTTIGYTLSTAIVVVELSRQIPTATSHPLNLSVILVHHQRGIVLHIVRVIVIVWRTSVVSAISLRFLCVDDIWLELVKLLSEFLVDSASNQLTSIKLIGRKWLKLVWSQVFVDSGGSWTILYSNPVLWKPILRFAYHRYSATSACTSSRLLAE